MMSRIHKGFLVFLCISLLINLIACDDKPSTETETPNDVELRDSAGLEQPNPTEEVATIVPELLGKWKLVDMKIGSQSHGNDGGNSTLEFRDDGRLVSESDGLPTETFDFIQDGDILAADMWDQDQQITTLTDERLVLTESIDGEEVHYVYQRVN